MKDWISQAGMMSGVRFASGASCSSLSLAAANYSTRTKAMASLVSMCMPTSNQCCWTFHLGWIDWHIVCFAQCQHVAKDAIKLPESAV